MKKNLCVLIPSFNESKTIGEIVHSVRSKGFSVCVIDDGSSDDTASIARQEGANVLAHNRNEGKGASLQEGFSYALRHEFSLFIVMDGDGQHHPEDIDKFLNKLDESNADIVVGNRMADSAAMPRIRFLTNKIMSFFISRMAGQHIPDTQCGFRLIKKKVLEAVNLDASNFETESELLLKAAKKGFIIRSVPIQTIYDDQKSRIAPLRDTIRFIAFIIKFSRLP